MMEGPHGEHLKRKRENQGIPIVPRPCARHAREEAPATILRTIMWGILRENSLAEPSQILELSMTVKIV